MSVVLWLAPGAAQEQDDLPQSMTAPETDPRKETAAPSISKTDSEPQDQASPAGPQDQASPVEPQDQALPAAPPKPEQRPKDAGAGPEDAGAKPAASPEPIPYKDALNPDAPKPIQGPPQPPSLVGAVPPEEIACRAELRELGVSFEPRPPESGENGCALPYPLAVSSLGEGIAVKPPLVANCAVARTTASFMQSEVQAAAERHLGSRVVALANGSGYVCRPRRGTQKLSEHALGNAIDIMSFELSGDQAVVVGQETTPKEKAFVQAVREAACGPFTTVLGPGSDADHSDHLHLDLAERRQGATFCQ